VIVAIGIVSIVVFVVAFAFFGIVPIARLAVSTSLTALGAMRDPALDDAVRERVVRRASITMLRNFASILVRGAGILAVSCLPILLADRAGLAPAGAVVEFLSRWDVIVAISAVMGAAWLIKDRAWPFK